MLSLWVFVLHVMCKRLLLVAVSGQVLGIACIVRPIAMLFPIAVLVYERWGARESWRQTVLVTAVFTVSLSRYPTRHRAQLTMYHFILVSTNGGVDLWQGTKADGVYFWSWDTRVNPLLPYQHDDFLENKVGMHVALSYIMHHPISTSCTASSSGSSCTGRTLTSSSV